MSTEPPPDWAIARACDLLNAEKGSIGAGQWTPDEWFLYPPMRVISRLIAEHKEAPVDPIAECLREAFGAAAPEFVDAFKIALRKRDMAIIHVGKVEAQ